MHWKPIHESVRARLYGLLGMPEERRVLRCWGHLGEEIGGGRLGAIDGGKEEWVRRGERRVCGGRGLVHVLGVRVCVVIGMGVRVDRLPGHRR